ncbi:hypothetical protein LguiB_009948 [Lonicera macranthoides]
MHGGFAALAKSPSRGVGEGTLAPSTALSCKIHGKRATEVTNALLPQVLQNLINLVHLDRNNLPICSSSLSRSNWCSKGGPIGIIYGIAGSVGLHRRNKG